MTSTELTTQKLDKELLNELVRVTARERTLSSEEVVTIIEEALGRVLLRNNKRRGKFRVFINRENFELRAEQYWEIISDDEPIEDVHSQKTLEFALETHKDAEVGSEITVAVQAPDLNLHSNAQIFKQNYLNCLRQAEHGKLLDELLERKETLVNGTIKRIDRASNDYIVEVHKVECRMRRGDSIPREILRQGDRIRCLIREIKEDPNRGRIVMLTRTSDEFLHELFRREVPEIEKGIIEIMGVARDPGYRSKIVVRSKDPKVDPVGTCVGMRGSRVQSVTSDLGGEKVDIIPWDEKEINFVLSALAPAEITTVRITGDQSCDVIVEESKLAQAIGKGGMNVKLASKLTGWQINIASPKDAESREQERLQRKSEYFINKLNVEESVAKILYEEGFESIEDIADTSREELLEVEGFNDEIADALLSRSNEAIENEEKVFEAKKSKCDSELEKIAIHPDIFRALVTNDILTVQDLAEAEMDELLEKSTDLNDDEAYELIMNARKHLGYFDDEAK